MPKPTYEELEQRVRHLEAALASAHRKDQDTLIGALKWQWQTTFDAVSASICVLDADWTILQCNQATTRRFQKPVKEIIGRKCYELVHGTMAPLDNCPVKRVKMSCMRESEALRLGHRWVEIAVDPILDELGHAKAFVHSINDITEHKPLAASLQKRKSTLRSIFKVAPTGIGMIVGRKFAQANDRLCEMTGYAPGELIGQSPGMLYPSDEVFELVGKEKYRQIDQRGTGERKQSEAALRMFKIAVEASSDAIGMATPTGRHCFQNKAFDDLFGNVGEDPPATLYVDPAVGREVFQSIRNGRNWSGEVEMNGTAGNKLQILLRAYAVKNEQGRIISLVGVHTDITARKRFELDLQRSEQRFRALAELLPQTIYEADSDGRLTFVNKNAFRVFGCTKQDFQNGLSIFNMIVPEDRARVQANLLAILHGKINYEGRKYMALRKDGSTFPVLIYSSTNPADSGTPGVRGIIIDVSEQEKLAQERDNLKEQYIQAQKMEAIGRLAGGVAHDLNNLLAPIVGYSELLLETMSSDAPDRKAVDQIFGAGMRAREIVRQLLAFSRKQTLELKSVDLNQVLADFKTLLGRILRDDIELELKLASGASRILADPGQIEQVVMNLAVNAQDAMPAGGKITIEVNQAQLDANDAGLMRGVSTGRYIVLTFRDTGIGMDATTKEKIFDPFFTTKGQGKGTGLGLATVYGIVKQHNGTIIVHSEPESGTAFKIFFPAAAAPTNQMEIETPKSENPSGSESILIVEDNDAVRDLAQRILTKYGYRTLTVNGGRACREILAQRHDFDLLLTDVVLQDTNGKDLYEQVRTTCPGIRVLYMSGYTDDVIGHHGVLEEGISFIQKPFSIEDLLKKVRSALNTQAPH